MIELKKQSAAPVPVDTGDLKNINLNKQVLKGENGGYYIPYINQYCDLYFTPTKPDMPSVPMKNIRGNKGEKGEAGKDGADGYSPKVYLGDLDNGTRVYIVTKEGTTQFDVLNGKDGKDGEAKLTVKSKYYANDWSEGAIYPTYYSNSGEISYFTMEDLTDVLIVDIAVRYNGVDYLLKELPYKGMSTGDIVISIPRKPIYVEGMGYVVARTHNDYDGFLYMAAVSWDTAIEGFTVYYIGCEEVGVVENETN